MVTVYVPGVRSTGSSAVLCTTATCAVGPPLIDTSSVPEVGWSVCVPSTWKVRTVCPSGTGRGTAR